jgi:hypothetical protein
MPRIVWPPAALSSTRRQPRPVMPHFVWLGEMGVMCCSGPRRWRCAAGGHPFGELRPALALRDDVRENGGALDGVRALPAKGKNFSFRGCIRRPMGHPPGPTTCTAVRGAPPLRKKVVNSQRTTKAKARRSHSLPLLTYSRLGGLRQDPGRAAESSAGPRTDEDMGARRACVVVDLWGTR